MTWRPTTEERWPGAARPIKPLSSASDLVAPSLELSPAHRMTQASIRFRAGRSCVS
jgi:hypothetical protein